MQTAVNAGHVEKSVALRIDCASER